MKKPKALAEVDLDQLGEQIKATAIKVKENDPAEMKRQLAKARQELALEKSRRENQKQPVSEVPVLVDTQLHHIKLAIHNYADAHKLIIEANKVMTKISEQIALFTDKVGKNKNHWTLPKSATPLRPPPIKPHIPTNVPVRTPSAPAPTNGDVSIGKCERAILTALAQYPQGRTQLQIATLTGYGIGSTKSPVGLLRRLGMITHGQPILITEAGLKELGDGWTPLPTGKELQDYWLNKLPKCESAILKSLIDSHPTGMTSEELAAATGYGLGSLKSPVGYLRRVELITHGQPIKASEEFFQ